jgi:hypothetical protein
MTTYIHANGDTIETNGSKYTVTRSGIALSADVSKWQDSAEAWIDADIRAGYYEGFRKAGA